MSSVRRWRVVVVCVCVWWSCGAVCVAPLSSCVAPYPRSRSRHRLLALVSMHRRAGLQIFGRQLRLLDGRRAQVNPSRGVA